MHADTETLTRWQHCTITGGAGTRWNLLEPSGETLVAVVQLAGSHPRLYWQDGIMQDADNLGDALRLVRLIHPAADLMPGVSYEQPCRDCGELFPYDPDADTCPACLAELGVTAEDVAAHAAMDRGEVSA